MRSAFGALKPTAPVGEDGSPMATFRFEPELEKKFRADLVKEGYPLAAAGAALSPTGTFFWALHSLYSYR